MKKVLLVCVTSQNVLTFRRKMIEALQKQECEVSVIAFDDTYRKEIESMGVTLYCVEDSNRSTNPFRILSLEKKYRRLIEKIAPDIVFTFMLKPNAFGVSAAKKAGIQEIYSMVEGAGDVFIYQSWKWKLIRRFVCHLYKKAFSVAKTVFFLNEDDKREFVERKLVKEEKCEIIHGVGVDTAHFAYQTPNEIACSSFLMVARLLRSKGVIEYCEAAKIVKARYPEAEFGLLGSEAQLTRQDLSAYIHEGIITYHGVTKDVRPYMAAASVNVLVSYREGFGLVNAEAAAIGRPSITGATVGTRDTVIDGYNGFLVPIRSAEALAEKMIWFIENPKESVMMGRNARELCKERFDAEKINEKLLVCMGLLEKESQDAIKIE